MNPRLNHLRSLPMLALMLLTTLLAGCGINNIPTLDEQAKAAWGQVQNQYQRRADLIPNLVETVKGYARHEQDTLTAVIEARAKATSIQVDASTLDNPETQAVPAGPGPTERRIEPADGGGRALSGPQGQPEFPGVAIAARRHREPHRRGPPRLHPGGAEVQHRDPHVPGCLWHSVMYSDLPIRETFEATSPNAEKAPEVKF